MDKISLLFIIIIITIINSCAKSSIKTNKTGYKNKQSISKKVDEPEKIITDESITLEVRHVWIQFIENNPNSVKVLKVPEGMSAIEIERGIKLTFPAQNKDINEKNIKKFITNYSEIDWREFR